VRARVCSHWRVDKNEHDWHPHRSCRRWGYPIIWGLAEGSNTISVKAEVHPGGPDHLVSRPRCKVACMCARKQSHRVAEMYPSLTGLWAELSQIACYGCLDVITKVVFGYILMSSHAVIDKVHDTEESECAPAACQGLVAWMGRVLPGWGCCRWGCPPGTVCDRCSPVFPCPHHERARACAGAGGSPT